MITETRITETRLKYNIEDSGLGSSIRDYISLMKPTVMILVVFTGFCGLYLAPGTINPVIAIAAVLCLIMGAGSAAAINNWYDRDIDAIMQRTAKRPIITGAIKADEAFAFGVITGLGSVLLMALCVNIIAASLLALTILYYIFIYTIFVKRVSTQNIVIGGVAGALPPMIGWAAVTGEISFASFSLFMIIFLWTPPHSWALALFRYRDYHNCKVPMLPVIKGTLYTKKYILFYTILMIATSFLPFFLKISNIGYGITALLLNILFLYYSAALFRGEKSLSQGLYRAKRLFLFSIIYLFVIFLGLIIFKTGY